MWHSASTPLKGGGSEFKFKEPALFFTFVKGIANDAIVSRVSSVVSFISSFPVVTCHSIVLHSFFA
jgi:hypothetical protein